MRVNPKSETEFKSRRLMDPGIYSFQVFDAIEKTSKSGNEMIEVILKVIDLNGRVHTVNDYLIDQEPMDYKIRHLWDSVGMINKYESGNISPEDIKDKKGKVKIRITKDKKGIYDDKNTVVDYIVNNEYTDQKILDDEIPW